MKMTEKLLYPPCHQTVQLLTGEEGEQANSEQRHRETEGQGGEVCPTKTINMLDCSWTQHTINNTITMCNNNRTITDTAYLCTVLHVFIYIYIYICVCEGGERASIHLTTNSGCPVRWLRPSLPPLLYFVIYLYMGVWYFGVSSFLILYMCVTVLCVTWSFNFLEGTSQKDE